MEQSLCAYIASNNHTLPLQIKQKKPITNILSAFMSGSTDSKYAQFSSSSRGVDAIS
jgi:hypothetical protein